MFVEHLTSLGEAPTIPMEETEWMIRNAPTLILGEEDPETPQHEPVQILHNWKHLVLEETSPKDSKPETPKSPLPAQTGCPAANAPEKEHGGNAGGTCGQTAKPFDRLTAQSFDDQDPGAMLEAICGEEPDLPAEALPTKVDEIILAPPLLPPFADENSVHDLLVCVRPYFEKGINPDLNIDELVPPVVSWMKQLVETPCHTMWGSECQKAIDGFNKMKLASTSFQERVSTACSTMQAIHGAALKSFRDLKHTYAGKPNQARVLAGQSTVLQKWVSTRQANIRKGLEVEIEKHACAINAFGLGVADLLDESYQQYLESQKEPKIDEMELFESLDHLVALQDSEKSEPEVVPIRKDVKIPDAAPQTMTFEGMREMIGKACQDSGATIDAVTCTALATKLGIAFGESVFHAKDPVPVHHDSPPNGDAQALIPNKDHGSLNIL